MNNVKLALILLAGGKGKRLNKKISKQMISYNNITILEMNIINFKKYINDISIQIVTNKQDFLNVSKLCKKYNLRKPVIGGSERHESTYNALKSLENIKPKYVLIHDTARPIVSQEVINKLISFSEKDFNFNFSDS